MMSLFNVLNLLEVRIWYSLFQIVLCFQVVFPKQIFRYIYCFKLWTIVYYFCTVLLKIYFLFNH